ncbi:hypothetical protein KIW84_030507 [Lathyrus oleraceus]|uniref:Uncharacterized protein n=1 Tax=Pisum sativum TaxID=3888 RepID=A0A9D5AZJ7_PEA|nr:hypothetical protein KIW84_030507 [Pisum sativum]
MEDQGETPTPYITRPSSEYHLAPLSDVSTSSSSAASPNRRNVDYELNTLKREVIALSHVIQDQNDRVAEQMDHLFQEAEHNITNLTERMIELHMGLEDMSQYMNTMGIPPPPHYGCEGYGRGRAETEENKSLTKDVAAETEKNESLTKDVAAEAEENESLTENVVSLSLGDALAQPKNRRKLALSPPQPAIPRRSSRTHVG